MLNYLNKNTKILALTWLGLNLVGLIYILHLKPLNLDGDILNLISEKGSSSDISLGQELLHTHSKEVKFGLEEGSPSEIEEFKLKIKNEIPELEEFSLFNKESLKKFINDTWPYLLSAEDLKYYKGNNTEEISKRIKLLLSGPESYFYSNFITEDPLLIASPKLKSILEDASSNDNKVLTYKIREFTEDKALTNKIYLLAKNFNDEHPKTKVHWSGYVKFKTSSAEKIKKDIEFVSTISSILIPIILILFFRSLKAPLLSILSSLSGMLFGAILVSIFKDSLHLITLAFGSSLVGASVDYAIHYQSEHIAHPNVSKKRLRELTFPSLLIGALTSIIAFIGLSFSHFPGLKELSIFSVGSLIASFLCTVLWYPYLSVKIQPKVVRQTNTFLNLADRSNLKTIALVTTGLTIIFSLLKIDFNRPLFEDDISTLQSPDKNLIEEEIWFKSKDKNNSYTDLLFITSNSLNKDLLHIGKKLRTPILKELPTEEDATLSFNTLSSFLNENKDSLSKTLKNIGYSELLVTNIFSKSNKTYLESISTITSNLRIRPTIGFIPVNNHSSDLIKELQKSNPLSELVVYNHREKISSKFKEFRIESIYLLSISYLIILTLLISRYGLLRGLKALSPSLLALSTSLLTIYALGIPVSFFGILAFVIVLGLSIDYSAFYMENTESHLGAKLSIFLCTLTTIITFGALSMSETESLNNFGIVISLGVFFTAIYTNLIFSKTNK